MPSMVAVMRARVARVLFRSRAYKRALIDGKTNQLSQDGQIILAHLKRFSRYGKPPVAVDKSGATDMFEVGRMVGRQETVQLIVEASIHTNLCAIRKLQGNASLAGLVV